eukprot:gnl/TRDRNA2_/TRDRNA2_172280_c8_seq1.p1 gnl/TRDRNA2_/TRDRNA2_172280_c8~~gnl/TRDRNA2_/TRDRNA2_172280_c8_seq1.p1  ORF type:complete len:294 (+),score=34.22 gnl/TRDRNA2_/TRDRNA2_172280_c8_seq1:65-946(+)
MGCGSSASALRCQEPNQSGQATAAPSDLKVAWGESVAVGRAEASPCIAAFSPPPVSEESWGEHYHFNGYGEPFVTQPPVYGHPQLRANGFCGQEVPWQQQQEHPASALRSPNFGSCWLNHGAKPLAAYESDLRRLACDGVGDPELVRPFCEQPEQWSSPPPLTALPADSPGRWNVASLAASLRTPKFGSCWTGTPKSNLDDCYAASSPSIREMASPGMPLEVSRQTPQRTPDRSRLQPPQPNQSPPHDGLATVVAVQTRHKIVEHTGSPLPALSTAAHRRHLGSDGPQPWLLS